MCVFCAPLMKGSIVGTSMLAGIGVRYEVVVKTHAWTVARTRLIFSASRSGIQVRARRTC